MLARLLARAKSSEVNGHHTHMGASDVGRRLVLARLLTRAISTEVNGYHTYMGAHKSTEVNGYRKSCANLIRRAMQQLNGPNDGAMRIKYLQWCAQLKPRPMNSS